MSLRDKVYKNSVAYPAIFAALSFILIIVFYAMSATTIKKENERKAQILSMNFQDAKTRADSYSSMLSSYEAISMGAYTARRQLVTGVINPIFENIVLTVLIVHDKDGYVIARAHNKDVFGEDQSKVSYVKSALRGDQTREITTVEGRIAMINVHPIIYNEKKVGAVTAGYWLDDKFAARLARLSGAEVLISYDGKVIASSIVVDSAGKNKKLKLPETINPKAKKKRIAGKKYDLANIPLSGEGFENAMITLATDNSSLYRGMFLLALVCALLIALVFLNMIRKLGEFADEITSPIIESSRAADRVAGGDLDVEALTLKSDDEIGRMRSSFNVMVSNLKEMVEKDKNQREYLESQAEKLLQVINAAAQGDFSARFDATGNDSFAQIGQALNKMIVDLDTLIASDTARRKYLETKISELLEIISAAADGDFSKYYSGSADDEIGKLGVALSEMIVDLQGLMDSANSRRRYMEGQVSELLKVMQETSAGNFSVAYKVKRDDEIGRLGKALNTMISELKIKLEQIESMKQQDRERTEWLEGQVSGILKIVEKATEGDLTAQLTIGSDEGIIADLKSNLNKMFSRLGDIVSKVRQSTDSVERAGREIQEITEKLQRGAAAQAKTIEKTAALGDTMAQSMQLVAEHSEDVLRLSLESNQGAARGGQTISRAVGGMSQVEEAMSNIETVMDDLATSAEEIDEIVKVIDEISDQTNLLALNAAIEAARAGDYGRGFSVVAKEISSLAQKSSDSTREITNIIHRIQERVKNAAASTNDGREKVAEGVSLADEAGKALEEIVASVSNVTSLIRDTADSIDKRKGETAEIQTSMRHVLQISEESSKLASQTADAVLNLTAMARELEALVKQIRIKEKRV